MKHVLLVNDDGIDAPGLRALWEALEGQYELTVVAPNGERSGSGMSISFYSPLRIRQHKWGERVYSVSGTPADCVKIALSQICDRRPDLILSGINPGSNAGRNPLYSGTVGAILEGGLSGVPGAALSCLLERDDHEPDYSDAAAYAPLIAEALLSHPLPEGTVLNVNFPVGEAKGLRMARQGRSYWRESPVKRHHPEGHPYYWLGGIDAEFEEHPESDIALLREGYATAVPLNIGLLTCTASLEVREIFENNFTLEGKGASL